MGLAVRGLLLAAVVEILGGTAWGDGKFYVREKVPADVPYQRAILLFHEGSETLVLQEYIDHGWCFVTAQVDPNRATDTAKVAKGGLVAPLILHFASRRPIYPLALTATVGTETEILIYTLSDSKLTCGERLTLRHATPNKAQDVLGLLVTMAVAEEWPFLRSLPETSMMLCKFKGRLTAAQMKEDLVFEAAADNEPYREHRTVW